MSLQRNHVVLPLKAGQFCIMVDDSDGGRFPDALFDSEETQPLAGLHRVEKVFPKTYTAVSYYRNGKPSGGAIKRYRREHVIAVTETLEQILALIDSISALAKHALWQEDIERKRIRCEAGIDILSLLPHAFIVERGAA
ncbi:hypothetical protein F9K88_08190 [Brucella intermedia]|uniref:hypothetical protein n=1 Tax=Brucella intermedia TaxID=94625 RepID=UPI00124BED59|nr:hypothetical protein [Brucella intermedia]KAB2712924.1 hypothetical protein F9K88_08190 [Brucella intermedia]